MLEKKDAEKDGEGAVRIVKRVGKDAVNAEHHERQAQRECQQGGMWRLAKQVYENAPCQHGGTPAHHRAIDDVVPEGPAIKPDEGSLNEKGKRGIRKGEIAIGNLSQ